VAIAPPAFRLLPTGRPSPIFSFHRFPLDSTNLLKNDVVSRAAELARIAHTGQFRRDGVTPYIHHPEAVALRVRGDPVAEAAAWLHDVLEDTNTTVAILREKQIPEEIIACVVLLTNKGDVGYERYLSQIKADPVAKKVKVADLLTNLSDHPSERQIVKCARGLLVLLG
jgi:(p)ppGpp synthase/HD superfamily hydrolase